MLRAYKNHHSVLLFITFFVVAAWAIFIAELAVARKVENEYNNFWAKHPDHTAPGKHPTYPDWRWSESATVGQFFLRAYALLAEGVHLPIHHYLLNKRKLHPITSLCASIIMLGVMLSSAILTIMFTLADENDTIDTFNTIDLAKGVGGMLVIVSIGYFFYMIFAARSVHEWRTGRRVGGDVELRRRKRAERRTENV